MILWNQKREKSAAKNPQDEPEMKNLYGTR